VLNLIIFPSSPRVGEGFLFLNGEETTDL